MVSLMLVQEKFEELQARGCNVLGNVLQRGVRTSDTL